MRRHQFKPDKPPPPCNHPMQYRVKDASTLKKKNGKDETYITVETCLMCQRQRKIVVARVEGPWRKWKTEQ